MTSNDSDYCNPSGLSSHELTELVSNPPLKVTALQLPKLLAQRDIIIQTRTQATGASVMAVLQAVRGALGKLTLIGASDEARADKACTFIPASLHDLMFFKRQDPSGRILTPPYRFGLDISHQGDFVVTLRLFGVAVDWAPAMAELLALVLTNPIYVDSMGKCLLGLKSRHVKDTLTKPLYPDIGVQFVTKTPVRQRSGHTLNLTEQGLRAALLQRFLNLCAWHGVWPSEQPAELKSAVDGMPMRLEPLYVNNTSRYSGRQKRRMHVAGWQGYLIVQPLSELSSTIVSVAMENGIGSSTSLGYGRLELVM